MDDRDDVCVLVPTYNEAAAIREVIEGFQSAGYENILVIDGGSTDGTQEIASEAGARVVEQRGDGKGQAVQEAIRLIEAPYVLMADGDATYRPDQADRMVEPLLEGRADHVIGNRFVDMQPGAMSRLNRIGNRLINTAFRIIHGEDLVDILSGYRAFTLEFARSLSLSAEGFGIETELAVECVKHRFETEVVPITYEARPEASETNLRPFRDGAVIILTLYQMAKTNNPRFYFGSAGLMSTLIGLFLAGFVALEWLTRRISHEVIAVVAGVAILFGIQLIMFGVLSDLIVTVNREQTRQFERVTERLHADTVEVSSQTGSSPEGGAVATESGHAMSTSLSETGSDEDGGLTDDAPEDRSEE